jgi:hypothetical protein
MVMSVNSEMTAIADLIRGLRGVSGKMGLDAMKGHLQDEQDGLDSALAALAEKGVTVPAGTKVDGLAALIAAIESGGGGVWVEHGTRTLDTNATDFPLYFNSGKYPYVVIMFHQATSNVQNDTSKRIAMEVAFNPDLEQTEGRERLDYKFGYGLNGDTKYLMPYALIVGYKKYNDGSGIYLNAGMGVYSAGTTYEWFAIGGIS